MKIYEKVEIIAGQDLQPSQLLMVFLILLASFCLGAIPLIMASNFGETNSPPIPSEATLWYPALID